MLVVMQHEVPFFQVQLIERVTGIALAQPTQVTTTQSVQRFVEMQQVSPGGTAKSRVASDVQINAQVLDLSMVQENTGVRSTKRGTSGARLSDPSSTLF